jgi:hypothetical protein
MAGKAACILKIIFDFHGRAASYSVHIYKCHQADGILPAIEFGDGTP